MDSSKDADAAVGILHPLSTLTWIDYEEVRELYDKTQTVYITQQSTLYTSVRTGSDVGDLYFCNWPFRGQKIVWKGPHNSIKEKSLIKYALAAYGSDLAIVGGWNQISRCSTDQVWILHKESSRQPKLLPSPISMLTKRHSGVAIGTEKYLAVTGGENEDKNFLGNDVEVYNGTLWMKVTSLPKQLRNLTSIIHDGVWYLVEEVDENKGGATYSASLEELVSSQDAEWKRLDQCSSGEMLVGPVSFDGQLLIIKQRWSSGYGIHMLSPKMKSWVYIASVPLTQGSVDRIRHASMVGLPEGQLMVMATDFLLHTCIKIANVKGADFNKDDKFSLMSLTRLEHGYNIPVLASLSANHLWKLKDKAVFDLKFNEGSENEPAVNIYINSWLEDEDPGCPPSWNNLLVLLSEVGLQDIAKRMLEILTLNSQSSLSDISIANGTGVETLLNVQSQLDSLSISVHEESAQDLSMQIQSSCHAVVWEQRKLRRELEKMREQQSLYLPKRIENERMREMLKQSLHYGVQQSTFPPPKKLRTSQQGVNYLTVQAGNNQDQEPQPDQPKRLNDRPKLHELDLIEDKGRKVKLIERLAAKWKKLATRLYFEHHHIQKIEHDNPRSSEDCCRNVFMEWLDGRGRKPISWKVVIAAISEAELSSVAEDLTSILQN